MTPTHPDLVALGDGTPRHVALQTPVVTGAAIELAATGSNVFRKEVLKAGTIEYKGQPLEFTPDYLDGLVLAHAQGVYPTVPLVFAGPDNAHTQDVERIRGEVLSLEREASSLYALVRASNDDAAKLLRENPNIGVSVRIEQPVKRADGKVWDHAVQHVLATANPVVPGLSPWQPVELSAPVVDVIDLSTLDFASSAEVVHPTDKEPSMTALTDEETAQLRSLLAAIAEAEEEPADEETDGPSDEELAALAQGLLDEDKTKEPVALSAETTEALELANQRIDAQAIELAQIRAERDAERYARLRDQLATDHGIPPAITELARPLLTGARTIELSAGQNVDVGEIVRKVMVALADHTRLVDLSRPIAYDTGTQDEEASAKARAEETKAYRSKFGL